SGINSDGDIVGSYIAIGGGAFGYLRRGDEYTRLDFSPARYTIAGGINTKGAIVGYYFDDAQKPHGFLFMDNNLTTIDYPDPTYFTFLRGINASGQIVGTIGGPATHAFLLTDDEYIIIDPPSASYSQAGGINDAGTIVGSYDGHGFLLWDG